ncbi:MBOAT family protein [Pseudoflavonifractor sp. 524-17]|uniref:MBOAT family O-acyltransferase n=1 Tax=Pseudoflavonifractor sp. 524-17 TaxID=2304577 RepID=UPI0013798183|nr:MBOAT family protein [Pseudoflavonifractor sp. 524-17]NCE65807.1 MBOAT family protein [Pseudoflavonifractor sp. 524-17]
MVFSSVYFLFLYLPAVLLIYYITPLSWRNGVLLLFNLLFYGWGEPRYILIMFASIAIDYTHGILVTRCKRRGNDRGARLAVASSVFFNLALLFFFKYWDFLARSLSAAGVHIMPVLNIRLPIGISFYTFQTMSYTIDVYRGDARCQRNIITFGTFVTLFPQLIAGPIIKYKDLDRQLEKRTHSPERFAAGVQIFVVGLAKKVLLANNLGMLWDAYKAMPAGQLTTAGAWLGIWAFSLQLYFDFSGYSDMATGLGRMLGFEFSPNFRYPYTARSITQFWRQWHISLGSWFREYLYIPLGGSRVGRGRLFLNLLVVWAATGIWHGASWNFLLWGLYFAALLIAEKFFLLTWLERLPRPLQHLYTLFFVLVSWAIFAVEDFSHMGVYLAALFGAAKGGLADGTVWYYLRSYLPMLAVGCTAALPLGAQAWNRLKQTPRLVLLPVLLLAGLVLSTAYLVDATYNPFLYFRF